MAAGADEGDGVDVGCFAGAGDVVDGAEDFARILD